MNAFALLAFVQRQIPIGGGPATDVGRLVISRAAGYLRGRTVINPGATTKFFDPELDKAGDR